MSERTYDVVGHAFLLAALVVAAVVLVEWARTLRACAPRNSGRRLRAVHVGGGTWKLRVSWRDRRAWVRGRDLEWSCGRNGSRPCNPAMVPWLSREWAQLEARRREVESAKWANRVSARPEKTPDLTDDSDALLDELETDASGVSGGEEYDYDNDPTILEATT